MICLICGKGNSINIQPYGLMPCLDCQKRQRNLTKPKQAIEVTTSQIKEDRKIFKSDIVQPFRDSNLSREFVEAYPDKVKQMVTEGHITEREVKESKAVWGLDYYKQ
jgi:ribosome-binding protein aMBF1 (putative translation factor)